MVRRLELLAVLPLNIVHNMTAVFAAMQADRNETGLARHEAGALLHQLQHLGLVVGRNLHGGDLGHDPVVFADLGHVRLLLSRKTTRIAPQRFGPAWAFVGDRTAINPALTAAR